MAARRRVRCGNRWRRAPSPAPRPTTRRSPRGSPAGSARRRRRRAPSSAGSPRRSAMARTRSKRPRSTARASSASASPPPSRCRARSSPTTISTTPTRPTSWSPSSIPRQAPPSPSSSMPIHAAWRSARRSREAYAKALACDPVSAFGGIVALNRKLDADAAREIVKIFTEVIIAPDASDEAKAILAEKKNSAPAARRRAAGPEGGRAQLSARSPAASSCSRATTALRARSRW